MNVNKIISFFLGFLLFSTFLFASDRTDALELLTKCENEVKQVEITVKNFGEKAELADYEQGLNLIKLGKIKLAQTNYLDAKAKFEEFLKFQNNIYMSLAGKYIKRTETLVDEISNELANDIGNEKVLKNFESAASHLNNAKQSNITKHFVESLMSCRISKKYLLSNYELTGKKIPEKYLKDFSDCNNKIHQ